MPWWDVTKYLCSACQREVLHKQEDLSFLELAGLQYSSLQCRKLSPKVHAGYPFKDIDHEIDVSSDFFDYENKDHYEIREKIAQMCLDDLITFINIEDNKVAIFDGTNTTAKRRSHIAEELKARINCKYQLVWIESICSNEEIISENIQKVKLNDLDYKSISTKEAEYDFRTRIKYYEKVYETLNKDEGFSFIKTINVG